MKRIKKYLYVILAFFIVFICTTKLNKVYAGEQKYNSMDFTASLNEDGSMNVTETWDVYVSKTSTLFKEFILDETKFGDIEDVIVKEIYENGSKNTFNKIYEEMYKVTPNCYYGLVNSKGRFEIAWGTGLENSSDRRKYEISYKVQDVIKTYNDCNEFCWNFVPAEHNSIVEQVTGTIYLPTKVSNMDNFRVWAHGPLNGNINRVNESRVDFDVTDVDANEFVEVRIAVLEDIFLLNTNTFYENKFNQILQEEKQFVDEANAQREKEKQKVIVFECVTALIILCIILNIIKRIKKDKIQLSKLEKIEPTERYKYYRELPNENMTAGDIGFIYYYKNNKFKKKLNRIFSANILSLYLKGYIELHKDKNNKLIVDVNKKVKDGQEVLRDERTVLNIFTQTSRKLKQSFTMKEFRKHIKKLDTKKVVKKFEEMQSEIESNASNKKVYSLSQENIRNTYKNKKTFAYGVLLLIIGGIEVISEFSVNKLLETTIMWLSIFYIVLNIIDIIIINKVIKRSSELTQKGVDAYEKIDGLKRFLKDFSLIKERETLDVVLWREYLICAVVLGLPKKVIKELMIEMPDANVENDYFHYINLRRYTSSIPMRVSVVTRFINTANSNYSSGDGYGGGFSGGSAGGGGGGSFGGR